MIDNRLVLNCLIEDTKNRPLINRKMLKYPVNTNNNYEHGTNYNIKEPLYNNCYYCNQEKDFYLLLLIDKVKETYVKGKMPIFVCQCCFNEKYPQILKEIR